MDEMEFEESKEEEIVDTHHIDADKVMTSLGKYARYQLFAVFLVNYSWCIAAFAVLSMAFANETPPFTCQMEGQNATYNFDNNCTIKISGRETRCGENGTRFVFDKDFGETTASEFGLVCEKAPLVHLGTSLFMAGTMVSMVIISQLADRCGRRWVFMISCWSAVVLIILSAFCPTFATFLIARFFTGFAIVGTHSVAWVLASEMVAPEIRFLVSMSGNIIWVSTYSLTGILAIYLRNWRIYLLVGSIPMILTISYFWLLPESLFWLIAKHKIPEARKWIEKACRLNGVKIDLNKCFIVKSEAPAKVHRHIGHVFGSPTLTVNLFAFSFMAITASFIYWGLSLTSISLSEDRYTGFILSGLIELPAGTVGPILLIWFGRKTVSFFSFLLSAAALLALIFVPENSPTWIAMSLSLTGKFTNIIMYASTFLLMTELTPTTVRNVSYGFMSTVGKIGSVTAPYVGIMAEYDRRLPPAIFGVLSLMCAVLHVCFAESRGLELPEDIGDEEIGPLIKLFKKYFKNNNS